jgi:multidrug efflux pump subunit AcrA (membrane-fusion protein)
MTIIVSLMIGVALFLVFIPWQQTVVGSGSITSFSPTARPQTVESIIAGRIARWYVQEGAIVKAGDTLVVMTDINVNFLDKQLLEKLGTMRDRTLSAQESAISVAMQRRRQAEERLIGSRARLQNVRIEIETARVRFARAEKLFEQDLAARKDLESATLALQRAIADSVNAVAAINMAQQDVDAFRNEEERVISQAQVIIQESEVRLANAQSRVGASTVLAPIDGTVVRIAKAGTGQTLKEGEQLAVIVPRSADQAAEIYVSGLDAALIEPGRLATLQFEGFPSFQFSGWQSLSVGIFHGRVKVVDAMDDGSGRFRVLIVPDFGSDPWPDVRFLRQGTSVTGWVMLDVVSVGFEIWRQLMGFPPQFPVAPPAKDAGPATKPDQTSKDGSKK